MPIPSSDPYEVLGVAPDADEATIRSAYREAALRHHPDRNPGDAAAEERFKAASEAYATLRDPAARQRYDHYRTSGYGLPGQAHGHGPRPDFSTVDWRVIFQEAQVPWASTGRPAGPQGHPLFEALYLGMQRAFRHAGMLPGEDRNVPMSIDLATARLGGLRRVVVPGPLTCPACHGEGNDGTDLCPTCGGARRLRSFEAKVQVPAGVRPGQKLRLQGLGGPGQPPGDAYVELSLSLPLGVRVEGRDLLTELYLTSSQARQGLRTEVLGTLVQVPPGSRDGQPLRVPHAGLNGGDLQLTLRVDELRGTMRSVGSWIGQAAGTLTQNLSEAWRERRRRRGP